MLSSLHRLDGGDFMLSTTNGEKPIAGIARKTLDKLHKEAENILAQLSGLPCTISGARFERIYRAWA